MIEMMEPTDWMDAASSSELVRLEPKWLRVTYTFAKETMEPTEWMKVAKDSNVLYNRTSHFWTDCSHTARAFLDILPTSDAGCFGAYRDTAVLQKFVDVGEHLVRENCHEARTHRSGISTLCPFDAPKLLDIEMDDDKTVDLCDTLTIHQHDQIYMYSTASDFLMEDVIVGKRPFVFSDANGSCGDEVIIAKTWIFLLSGAAATRSDLPGVGTGIKCPGAVGHETNCDKTIAVEYHKDSGRVGSLESFKNDFQKFVVFPSPTNGMVGWQNAHCDKQKQDGNKKPVFRPSQQQQHKATALDLSEVAPIDESGSYTSEGMYKDLNGKYEKTIYVKTWTGRTITAVFSPEKVTKIVKREIEAKTGIPSDHLLLVVRGRVLTDSALMKEHVYPKGRQSK